MQSKLFDRSKINRFQGASLEGVSNRTIHRHVIALAVMQTLGTLPASQAAVIDVTGQGAGQCTLRDAITSANTDTATGDCPPGDAGADIIDLTDATIFAYSDAVPDTGPYGDSALPTITSDITINGHNSTITRIPTATAFRLIEVEGTAAQLTLNELTLSGGHGTYGGGMFVNDDATATLSNTTLTENSATNVGGGILAVASTISLIESTVSGNSADASGGGVYASQSTLSIDKSTLSGNSADASGGAINSISSVIEVTNSTLSSNSAAVGGGGISANAGTLDFSNSTLWGNAATSSGASIDADNATTTHLSNTVIAVPASGAAACSPFDSLATNIDNWFEDTSCDGMADGDARLGNLLNNGGPTLTHAPLENSPLAGAGDTTVCTGSSVGGRDQRGQLRGTSSCFIGSVEGFEDDETFFVIPLPNGKTVVFAL